MFEQLSLVSKLIVCASVAVNVLLVLRILFWQTRIARGRKVSTPDGSSYDTSREPDYYAHAIGDITTTCPAALAAVLLVCLGHRMGYYLLAMVSFASVHIYAAQTATSVKFYRPAFNAAWIIVFPLNAAVGLLYLVWTLVGFDAVFSPAGGPAFSLASRIILYVFLAFFALMSVALWAWQFQVLRGKRVKNPGGEYDDWHVYPNQFGYAFSDVFWLGPSLMIGVVLSLLGCRFGYYWLALAGSVLIWCLGFAIFEVRAHKPRITFAWLLTFGLPVLVPLLFAAWTMARFDAFFSK